MIRTETATIRFTNSRPEPMSWPSLTFGQLVGSAGHIMQELRLKVSKRECLGDLPLTSWVVNHDPYEGSKDLLWTYECIGCSIGSRLVKFHAYELCDPSKTIVWGHFTIGRRQCRS
ncbi:MAG: hypothetical protein P4L81_05685 [Candidatus Pacebacteria bacterium]|nr:hypothetical protein [Candidatus Paceibacterota bacterium]